MASAKPVLAHKLASPASMHFKGPGSEEIWTTTTQLPRSASYTYLPAVVRRGSGDAEQLAIQSKHASLVSKASTTTQDRRNDRPENVNGHSSGAPSAGAEGKLQRKKTGSKIRKARPKSQIEDVSPRRSTDTVAQARSPRVDGKAKGAAQVHVQPNGLPRPNGSAHPAAMAQRVPSESSSSSSPSRRTSSSDLSQNTELSTPLDGPPNFIEPSPSDPPSPSEGPVKPPQQPSPRPRRLSMRQSLLGRKGGRPLSSIFRGGDSEANRSQDALAHISQKSMSTDKLPVLMKSSPSTKIPPLPRAISSDSLRSLGRAGPRKKDELWSIFRNLDSDFHRFQSKNSALKANVVRNSLLPFLRTYASHPSNKSLRPEDLDRRTIILNKWWIALLEMVDSGSTYTLSGTDRPVILEGITGIMTRPEWRAVPSSVVAASDHRWQFGSLVKSSSTMSLESTGSDFLAESAYHNTRNLFIHNLLTQTSIVVDKLSLRNAAASLVALAAKTLAYAFYFCPGVAEILVRLWGTPSNNIRHVVEEFGLTGFRPGADREQLASAFPKCLHPLRFSSATSIIRTLRRPPPRVLSTRGIDWQGPWLSRWCGRDTDLFFIFVKHWHILLEEFLPFDLDMADKARAPAFVIVHAQIMTVFQSTIHHPVAASPAVGVEAAPATTFDDVLAGADASADALPLPTANVTRQMAENRLIMLLRDVLSDRSAEHELASRTFATYFVKVLQAAARRISKFDHDACFTLCDFLEEAAYILDRYRGHNPSEPEIVDWAFWLSVCQQISESQNTMSEIRLFAFIYSIWGIIVNDERRKRALCLGWLLAPATFERFFYHWCPMSRAYYMRLLCWRLARAIEPSEVDLKIYSLLLYRLRITWQQFLGMSKTAKTLHVPPPTITPSNPAPGRRLLILRDDSQLAASHLLAFEDLTRPSSSALSTPSTESLPLSPRDDGSPSARAGSTPSKSSAGARRRWNILRNLRVFANPNSNSNDNSNNSNNNNEASRRDDGSRTENGNISDPSRAVETSPGGTDEYGRCTPRPAPRSVRCCFRFSLEWIERAPVPAKGGHENNHIRLFAPRLPTPALRALSTIEDVSDDAPLHPPPPPPPSSRVAGPATVVVVADKYMGRALTEWMLVVAECHNFFERRKNEGVLGDAQVETPTLGVDWFRRVG